MRRLVFLALLLLAPLVIGIIPARAAQATPEQAMLMQLFGSAPITADMFTPEFLARAPIGQIRDIFSKVRAAVGPALSVEKTENGFVVRTARYAVPAEITLAGDGRVDSFMLRQPQENFAAVPDVLKAIDGLPGQVAYLVTRNGASVAERAQDQPLAVFSGFKLAVLAALDDEIKAGRIRWDQVVRLDRLNISLTPGELQDFAPGSPVTVHTLAALMTAQSDNTATDQLIDLIGRDKVAARLGGRFVLKTTEFYKLKADPARQLRYIGGDDDVRRQIAGGLADQPLPAPADVMAPLTDKLEWYLSSNDLCRLIGAVGDLDVAQINPGVARRADWRRIAFKSGSEVGVASLTSLLTAEDGTRFCVSLTVNDHKALDEARVTALYSALVALLAKPGATAAPATPARN